MKPIINNKYLKEYSPIPLNYDLSEVRNYIITAQEIWVRPLLGDPLMAEIEQQVTENTLTEENGTLLVEALWPYLAYAVTFESLPFLWADISEKGITLGKSENSESINLKDLGYIQNHLRTQVEAKKEYLIRWLDDRAETFPLYHPSDCECQTCCQKRGKLKDPNPNYPLYGTSKCITDLI